MVDNAGVFMINVDSFIDDTTVFIRKNSEVLIGKLIVSDGILQTACIIYPLSKERRVWQRGMSLLAGRKSN